jgi:tRNA dimethylallyltransferase
MTAKPRLVCIVGQTASGKSSLAMALAEELGCELLSVDSMQVYRGFDIGTAKPSPDEQARVRHHGIDLAEPHESFSAGAFLAYARSVLEEARGRDTQVIAVGGTGLYLRALLHGLTPSAPADPSFRTQLRLAEEAEPGSAHLRLKSVDPEAAARIHANDFVRTERALEVLQLTGETQSSWVERHAWSDAPFETQLLGIRWDRGALRRRISERVDTMLAMGWIDEVRGLVAAGVTEDMTPMFALGYRDIAAHLRGELPLDVLRERISTAIGRFAKRQGTWFNREPSIAWMEPGPDLLQRALPRVREALLPQGSTDSRED